MVDKRWRWPGSAAVAVVALAAMGCLEDPDSFVSDVGVEDTESGEDAEIIDDTAVDIDAAPPQDTGPEQEVEVEAPPHCAEGTTFCTQALDGAGGCVDLESNADHCGECGHACVDSLQELAPNYELVCRQGSCDAICPEELTLCGDEEACVDLYTDEDHCGVCENACADDASCIDGECIAEEPEPPPICDEAQSPFGGGDGTAESPYTICSVEHLLNVDQQLHRHFELTADLDLDAVDFEPLGELVGIFYGGGHAIENLTVDTLNEPGGLFRQIGNGGVVSHLQLIDVDVSASNHPAGGLVGNNTGLVIGVFVDGQVAGDHNVGGLVGRNDVGIQYSWTDVEVTGSGANVGGMVGYNNAYVVSSQAHGDVSGATESVGGLVGFNEVSIQSCQAFGAVNGGGSYVGGLAGVSNGTIVNSAAWGDVQGQANHVGGLVGFAGSESTSLLSAAMGDVTAENGTSVGGLIGENQGDITYCYATGDVAGVNSVGGLVGHHWRGGYGVQRHVTQCHSIGQVSGSGAVGGLIGSRGSYSIHDAAVGQSFWDMEASGVEQSSGGEGLSTEAFSSTESFGGWDFSAVWEMSSALDEVVRPVLRWQELE